MRTVAGRTDQVVVVGAGLAGLAAAIRLAAAGRDVTILERASIPGGRAGLWQKDGFSFDTGPTVLTMPELLEDLLSCVGESLADWVELVELDPAYKAHYPDGSTINVMADPSRMAAEIESVCGPREAAGYARFVEFVSELYRLEINDFIDRNIDSPLALLTPNLARLAAIGGFRRLSTKTEQFFSDPRTRRIFSFQSMYAGLSPFDALALYSVIAYMDTVRGVFYPRGGLHSVPRALADVASKHGVKIRYDCDVRRVEHSNGRASAVITGDGSRIPADVVVLNPDLPVATRELLGIDPWTVRRLKYSPSCTVLLAGSSASYRQIAHHNIHFSRTWRSGFDDLIKRKQPMKDPSFFVTNAENDGSYCVLFPAPNTRGEFDWHRNRGRYRDHMVSTLEANGYRNFGDSIEVERLTTPADWEAMGLEAGAPFAASHSFLQTGPFRPRNIWGENVVFVGSGTTPGVGIPMVLISGRLAAERVTGLR